MRTRNLVIGTACGVALGAGLVATADLGPQTAGAQSGFTVSAQQLKINQRISSAATKRSNRGLNYLAPIRTDQTDAADDGTGGVRALAQVPGSGGGWTTAQIGDAAITGVKVADTAITTAKLADGAVTRGKLADEAVDSAKIAPGGVTSGDLADAAVTESKIDADAVSESKLSPALRAQIEETSQSTAASTLAAYAGEPIPVGSNDIVLNTGDDAAGKQGRGPLTFTVARRIVATGFVDVREGDVTTGIATCFFGAQQGPSTSSFTMPQSSVTVPRNTTVRVPITGTIDRDPGTYEVVIFCRGSASIEIVEMSLSATVGDQ